VSDRPNITIRVFNLFKTALIDELMKDNVFGSHLGYVHSIEFQKCGLLHMHLLLSLTPSYHLINPTDVNMVVRAM
jgi:hypothetical protein